MKISALSLAIVAALSVSSLAHDATVQDCYAEDVDVKNKEDCDEFCATTNTTTVGFYTGSVSASNDYWMGLSCECKESLQSEIIKSCKGTYVTEACDALSPPVTDKDSCDSWCGTVRFYTAQVKDGKEVGIECICKEDNDRRQCIAGDVPDSASSTKGFAVTAVLAVLTASLL